MADAPAHDAPEGEAPKRKRGRPRGSRNKLSADVRAAILRGLPVTRHLAIASGRAVKSGDKMEVPTVDQQLKAFQMLADRALPTLKSSELTGDPENPISRIETVIVDPISAIERMIISPTERAQRLAGMLTAGHPVSSEGEDTAAAPASPVAPEAAPAAPTAEVVPLTRTVIREYEGHPLVGGGRRNHHNEG